MYKTHQPRISKYALKSADNMAKVMYMVSLSIQQPWHSVGKQLQDVMTVGRKSRFLWGSKGKLYDYVQKHKAELFVALHDYKKGRMTLAELLVRFAEVDGLLFVKAGFVLQLCLGEVGCLDIHNLRMYGVNPADFKYGKNATLETKLRKAELYIAMCEKLGGSEKLWDTWCDNLANNPRCKKYFTSKHHVSRVHHQFLMEA